MPYSWFSSINFRFTSDFIQNDNSDYVWNKTLSSHVLTSKSLSWVQISTLGLFWTENEFFVDLVFTINLSFGSRGYYWLVFYHQFSQWVVFLSKESVRFYLKKKKKNILFTCFKMKNSHSESNEEHNIVLYLKLQY